ncbi:MAG: type II toxin-antitoxin system VapC family toxin [Caldilineaceae bacterium]
MFLWDTNILRAFIQGNAILRQHLERAAWIEIALPTVVVAEVLQGRCSAALKATPTEAPLAHERLVQTQQMLMRFHQVPFDTDAAQFLISLQQKHRRSKRYADLMIAATALAGRHTVVTRNIRDFTDVLPKTQLANWIDTPPR